MRRTHLFWFIFVRRFCFSSLTSIFEVKNMSPPRPVHKTISFHSAWNKSWLLSLRLSKLGKIDLRFVKQFLEKNDPSASMCRFFQLKVASAAAAAAAQARARERRWLSGVKMLAVMCLSAATKACLCRVHTDGASSFVCAPFHTSRPQSCQVWLSGPWLRAWRSSLRHLKRGSHIAILPKRMAGRLGAAWEGTAESCALQKETKKKQKNNNYESKSPALHCCSN